MPERIRILACSFALGVGMLLLGATAAHATPQSGAHVSGQPGGSYSPSPSPSGGCHYGRHHCKPKPTPTPTADPEADADLLEDADTASLQPASCQPAAVQLGADTDAELTQPDDRTAHPAGHG